MRLHIGGTEARDGWEIFNIMEGPGVDHVGDCRDLSRFKDGSVEEIYASHVLEHLSYQDAMPQALREWNRVLVAGGRALISVPDFDVICRLFVDPARDEEQRFFLMRIAFGGQMDPHDFHFMGFTREFLGYFLGQAGFRSMDQVEDFGLFRDTSVQKFHGTPISLNVIAYK